VVFGNGSELNFIKNLEPMLIVNKLYKSAEGYIWVSDNESSLISRED
jgi:ligand-binding sensor domain-containing protein